MTARDFRPDAPHRSFSDEVGKGSLPTTGEIVPLLQIAPSKTDEERVILVSPELADVLSAVIARIRDPRTGAVPYVSSYDMAEKTWNPQMPLLFQ